MYYDVQSVDKKTPDVGEYIRCSIVVLAVPYACYNVLRSPLGCACEMGMQCRKQVTAKSQSLVYKWPSCLFVQGALPQMLLVWSSMASKRP